MENSILAIGLISGTSVDGIDAALVEITNNNHSLQVNLIAGHIFNYDSNLRDKILAACAGEKLSLSELCELDDRVADAFADAAIAISKKQQSQPILIGSHGQTVFHRPPQASEIGYSFQLGRGGAIARKTGITTVSNFRAADIELGGQGAPLVPMVDWLLLTHETKNRCVQNIGGISNLAYLVASGKSEQVIGWDNAPGNVLMDMATQKLFDQPYDKNGNLAARGKVCSELVQIWLKQDFFMLPPPKSTGRELFSWEYLEKCLEQCDRFDLSNYDILATLTELTAQGIVQSYQHFLPSLPDEVLLCGGGARNTYLVQRLTSLLASQTEVKTTDLAGLPADFKEAIAFAVLGYLKLYDLPSNLPSVTGASQSISLGEIHRNTYCVN